MPPMTLVDFEARHSYFNAITTFKGRIFLTQIPFAHKWEWLAQIVSHLDVHKNLTYRGMASPRPSNEPCGLPRDIRLKKQTLGSWWLTEGHWPKSWRSALKMARCEQQRPGRSSDAWSGPQILATNLRI